MRSFIVVHERSIIKCDLINNIIKTILLRSIGLFLFFYEFMALFRCPLFFSRVATKLQSAYVLAKGGWASVRAGGRMLAYLR